MKAQISKLGLPLQLPQHQKSKQDKTSDKKMVLSQCLLVSADNVCSHEQTKTIQQQQPVIDNKKDRMIPFLIKSIWRQQPDQFQMIEGYIKCSSQCSKQQLQKIVRERIKETHHYLNNRSMIIIKAKLRKTLMTEIPKQEEPYSNLDIIGIQGYIIKTKINLPSSYTHQPTLFPGWQIPTLSISNQHGTITWLQPVNTQNIDFSTGLKILRGEIICQHQQLKKPMYVQFHQLPENVEICLFREGKRSMLERLRGCVDGQGWGVGGMGCRVRFVAYCESNNHWFVEITSWEHAQQL